MTTISTKYNMTKDIAGYNGFGLDVCVDSSSGKLTQNVADSVTVPSNYDWYIAIFSYSPSTNVFVNCVGTAAAPSGATAASQSVLLPSAIRVKKGTTISYITPDAAGGYISVRLFVCPPWTN